MRGRKVSPAARKEVDVVLIAARKDPENGHLMIAQACERRGPVWGDVKLLQRDAIIARIKEGKRVVTGRPTDLQGDFEVFAPVQVSEQEGEEKLFTGTPSTKSEDLGIPLF
jgi:hypothetical protein